MSTVANEVKAEVKAILEKEGLPQVEITAEDSKYNRQTYKALSDSQNELTRASTAIGETLYKLVHRAVTRARNDLAMARAYFEAWAIEGEKEWQRRDLQARVDNGEVEKGSSELRPINRISSTYSVYKSTFVSGLKGMIDPNEPLPLLEGEDKPLPKFSTANDYMKAAKEKAKASRAPRQPKVLKLSTVETGMTTECNALVGRIITDVRNVPQADQNATFETVLQQFSVTIANMLADYRVKHGGEKTGKIAVATSGDAANDAESAERIATENETAAAAPAKSRRSRK